MSGLFGQLLQGLEGADRDNVPAVHNALTDVLGLNTSEEVQSVLSNEQVQSLIQRTGLPVQALMPLVAKLLPHAVDQATPEGKIPESGNVNV
jgi:uncharacterized protein YidB (DUF937 family)